MQEEDKPSAATTSASEQPKQPATAQPNQASTDNLDFETDQPPVLIGGGSLFLELPTGRDIVEASFTPANLRPVRYQFTGNVAERGLETVRVVRQRTDGRVEFFNTGELNENLGCILKIWLQPLREIPLPGNPFENLQTEPDLQISGAQTIGMPPPFFIESKVRFQAKVATNKPNWPFRFNYPAFTRHFRIGRWQIVDKNNAEVVAGFTGDDDSRFYVTFHTH